MSEQEDHGPRYDLTCWYINMRRAAELLGRHLAGVGPVMSLGFIERSQMLAYAKDAFIEWMSVAKPATLGQLALTNSLKSGVFFTHYSDYYCKRSKGDGQDEVTCYSKLADPLGLERVTCNLRGEHFTSDSSWTTLSGRTQLFLLGAIGSIEEGVVHAIPYLVATLLTLVDVAAPIGSRWPFRLEVFPDGIDSFELIRRERSRRREADLEPLRSIPERQVKAAFAEILNEPTVPKDWAGERSDLFSTYVTIGGERFSTAFTLKGPARFRPMTFADLGKNGDQVDRLFSEPADLLVLQHCHTITPPVRNAMRAYASQITRPRLFMLMDGHDTLRLLRAYGKCGFSPTAQAGE